MESLPSRKDNLRMHIIPVVKLIPTSLAVGNLVARLGLASVGDGFRKLAAVFGVSGWKGCKLGNFKSNGWKVKLLGAKEIA